MTENEKRDSLPGLTGLIAGAFVILGVFLWMFVSKGLLFVAGLGAFGPGILRELGWLGDQDEFQRQAAHRAGYHAFLVGGLATVLAYSALEWWEETLPVSSEWVLLILIVLWLTCLFSALLGYWGARKTAARVLLVFGSFWALFVLANVVTEATTNRDFGAAAIGALMGTLIVGPFFILAWAAGRWPRTAGFLLLAVSVFFLFFFAPHGAFQWSTVLVRDSLLMVPLAASGLALLREAPEDAPA
jgi:hypothetical protein